MPQAGQILHCKNFKYRDGSVGQKLLVVLNSSVDYPCLVLKTTSQFHFYINALPGCNSRKKTFFVSIECNQGFDKDTFIQFPTIYPVDINDMLQKKEITFIGQLDDICFANLRKCLRNYKHDIAEQHWHLIYQSK